MIDESFRGTTMTNKKFREEYPTVEAFKKYCFQEAEKDQNLEHVSPSSGWGDHCLSNDQYQ